MIVATNSDRNIEYGSARVLLLQCFCRNMRVNR